MHHQAALYAGLVEYRYCNDDLALDVSELQLSDCLAQNQPQQLNAYERGYFSPALPQGAVWDGLRPNTSYTCKFYSLDANEDLTAKREQLKAIHSLSFTTSIYRSPDELSGILDKIKLRDIVVDKALYVSTIAQLRPELALPAFAHPTQANTTFAVGMDIFRELVSANAITADEKTPHQFEEAYQSLFETYSGSVRDQLKSESLVLDGIMESMGLNLEATSPKRIIGTWFRTPEENDGSRGSIGLLLEFPEPIDWERTGLHIASAAAKINGESEEIDLLAPPTGNPSYETTFHWLRSLDGTKLMFIPKLVKTSVYNPEVVLPDDSWMIREGFGLKDRNVKEAITKEPDAEISHADFFDNISKSSTDGIKPQIAIPNSRRISDYAVVTSSAATKSEIIERLKANYGTTVVRNIYDYEIQDLELHMYYFSDNYPDENVNFRAIPRIRFLEGKPGNFDGRIGIIRLVR